MTDRERTNVLVFNPGSNSLKFDVVAAQPTDQNVVRGEKLVSGVVEPINESAKLFWLEGLRRTQPEHLAVKDHGAAAEAVIERIDSGIDIHVVGHRVVHGRCSG